MVYCGKPSQSCANCRSRRIKCDLLRPSCTPCLKVGKDCPGYRRIVDLMFRDETFAIIAKHRIRQPARSKGGVETSYRDASRQSEHLAQQLDGKCHETTIRHLDQSILDVAVHLLLTKYVMGSHFDYLPVYCRATAIREPFRSAMESVALARFADDTCRPEVSRLAWRRYNLALLQTRKVLKDSRAAAADEMIASVLLLSCFEMISSDVSAATHSWASHIRGAYALSEIRGATLLETYLGRQLFRQIATSITLDCLQSHKRLPGSVKGMLALMRSEQEATDPRNRLQAIAEDLTDFRSSLAEGQIDDAKGIFQRAKHIDDLSLELASDMLEHQDFRFTTIFRDADVTEIGSCYHLYPSIVASRLWNSLRMLRIFVNEFLLDTSLTLFKSQQCGLDSTSFPSLLIEASKNMKTIAQMCLDICSSVPYSTSSGVCDLTDQASLANFLIWPLFKAGNSQHAPAGVRPYAATQLKEFGKKCHVRRAVIAAEQLEQGIDDDDWMHVSHMF